MAVDRSMAPAAGVRTFSVELRMSPEAFVSIARGMASLAVRYEGRYTDDAETESKPV